MKQFCFRCILIMLCLGPPGAFAQKPVSIDLTGLAKDGKLHISNRQVSILNEAGKNGVSVTDHPEQGFAWIDAITFSDGTIELDIKGRDVLQKSFVGVAFHGTDSASDVVYFRPFNFRSTDPVRKIHAVQYVSEPEFSWKRLREEQNGKYEKAVDPAPAAEDWFHVRIVVRYPTVTVFVNGNPQPSLTVDKLNKRKNGKVALWAGSESDGSFANLSITQDQTN